MIYASIDPGVSGGIAILDGDNVQVFSVPTKNIKKNGKTKRDFDIVAMSEIFRKYSEKDIIVLQEATHAMPNNGSVSMYFFGRGAGIWEGILTALQIKYVQVPPQTWKKMYPELQAAKIPIPKNATKSQRKEIAKQKQAEKASAKARARAMASSLYPNISEEFTRIKDDGKAESLLMAVFLRKNEKSLMAE